MYVATLHCKINFRFAKLQVLVHNYCRSVKVLAGPWTVDKVEHHSGAELFGVNITLASLEPISEWSNHL